MESEASQSPPQPLAGTEWTAARAQFGLGALLSETLGIWKRHPLPFVLVALVAEVPTLLVTLQQASERDAPGAPSSQLGGTLALSIASMLATSILTFGALEAISEKPVRLSAMVSTGLRRFGRVFGVSLMTGLVIGAASLLLLVPGFMVASALWLAVPATLAEPDSERSPIERSRELTKGHRWTTFFALLILLFLSYAAYFGLVAAVTLMEEGGAAGVVAVAVTALASGVAGGIYATAPAVAFHQLRTLKEGGDSKKLASVFE